MNTIRVQSSSLHDIVGDKTSPVVFLVISPHLLFCQPQYLLSGKFEVSWTAKNWMQYSASRVATMALPLSQNGLRSNLRASNF